MDPIITTLAANVVAYLIPYVKKGAEEFAGDVGKAATGKVKNLLNSLKTRLSGDKEATDQLIYSKKAPTGAKLNCDVFLIMYLISAARYTNAFILSYTLK